MKASKPVVSLTQKQKRSNVRLDLASGQAMAELIIACAILAIILMGIVTTINFSLNSATVALNKTLATHYATQYLEQARGARRESEAVFNGMASVNFSPIPNTIFSRRLTITDISTPANLNRVRAEVMWLDGTQEYAVSVVSIVPDF